MTDPATLPDIRTIVLSLLKKQGRTLSRASQGMGRSAYYLSVALRDRNPRIGMLMDLSDELGTNLLGYYQDHMPPGVRYTPRDVAYQQEIKALKAELETVKAERDKYWAVIAGRGN